MIDWHHLFGWTLMDYFRDSNYQVDLEKDLSVKPQLLDVIIIEKSTGASLIEYPDGLENLSQHNLLTYKSKQETLTTLVIAELLGHYTNYRKLLNPQNWESLPDTDFQLYAVTTRYPRDFCKQFKNNLKPIKDGVYDLQLGNHSIIIIVLSQIPKTPKNAIWQLFSSYVEGFEFGATNYKWRYPSAVALLKPLIQLYGKKEMNMPYTLEEAVQLCMKDSLDSLPPADRLRGLSLSEVVKYFSPAEVVKPLSIEERLAGLSPEDIEAYLAKQKEQKS